MALESQGYGARDHTAAALSKGVPLLVQKYKNTGRHGVVITEIVLKPLNAFRSHKSPIFASEQRQIWSVFKAAGPNMQQLQ